jgi:hypothetical protein
MADAFRHAANGSFPTPDQNTARPDTALRARNCQLPTSKNILKRHFRSAARLQLPSNPEASSLFARLNTGVLASNPTRGMHASLRLFRVCAVLSNEPCLDPRGVEPLPSK